MNPIPQAPVPNQLPQGQQPGQNPAQAMPQQPANVRMADGRQFHAGYVGNVPPAHNPQAGQIQDDWDRSVAELHAELMEIRDAMAELLRDINALLQNYNLHTQLQPAADAMGRTLVHVGNSARGIDEVTQTMGMIDTTGWDPAAAQSFHQSRSRFVQRLAQLWPPLPAQAPAYVQRPPVQVPQQPAVPPPVLQPLQVPPPAPAQNQQPVPQPVQQNQQPAPQQGQQPAPPQNQQGAPGQPVPGQGDGNADDAGEGHEDSDEWV